MFNSPREVGTRRWNRGLRKQHSLRDGRVRLTIAWAMGGRWTFRVRCLPHPAAPGVPDWRALLTFGTVLDEDEDLTSAHLIDAAAPSGVLSYHTRCTSAVAPQRSTH